MGYSFMLLLVFYQNAKVVHSAQIPQRNAGICWQNAAAFQTLSEEGDGVAAFCVPTKK